MEKDWEDMSDCEKMFVAKYVYEGQVLCDGFLGVYLNYPPEYLDYLSKAYETIKDDDNLKVAKGFQDLSRSIPLKKLESYELGSEKEDYSSCFELLK